MTGPTSTSDGDGINFVLSSQNTGLEISGDDYYDEFETEKNRTLALFFSNPTARNRLVKMTINEINKIFNKRDFIRNKNRHLTRTDKMNARECRRKKKLYFRKTKKCHRPLVQGPCKNSTKWIIAIKGRLDGVCRERPCLDDATPILYNGTCVPIDNEDCPQHSRLYMNKRGEGYCDCDGGYSQYEDGLCYREQLAGPCENQTVLVGGECVTSPCQPGEMMWSDGECHRTEPDLDQCDGHLLLDTAGTVTCQPRQDMGRAITGNTRNCRRGRVWSSWRRKCVRIFG